MNIKLGPIEIDNPLVLAPVAGFTDSPYRRIARRFGCGFSMTELVSAEGIIRNNKKTMELLEFTDEERPLGIQIFGRDREVMAKAAKIVSALEPDFIDINMGCPARKVCKDGLGSGAALLKNPSLAEEIAADVVDAVSLPVSAKIRIGWDASSVNFKDIIGGLCRAGVSFISVHGRTKTQGYGGYADWEAIGAAAEVSAVPVIGNGDVQSRDEAAKRLESTRCAAVMVGRAACANPWIFSGSRPPIGEIVSIIKEHLALNIAHYGDFGLILMRKHIVKYIHGIYGASYYRAALNAAVDVDEVYKILDGMIDYD
ncbi:MAG: tRNA dihydrouridine synthase DusB [Leptospirales bacterium]|nr:tRNA dihydrouridine synthase DusB [Leptospirales bacterium]